MDQIEKKESKRKTGKPAFTPGAFEVKIKTAQQTRTGVVHHFTLDGEALENFAVSLAEVTHPIELMVSHEPQDYDDYLVRIRRMWFAALAKKLASSLGAQAQLSYGGGLSRIGRMSLGFPAGLIPLVDSYGKVATDTLNWEMVGQPCWSLSLYGRACAPDMVVYQGQAQAVNRQDSFFVNMHSNNPFLPLRELLTGVIAAWATNAPPVVLAINGNNITMSVPKPSAGFAHFAVLVQAVPKPDVVTWAIACATVVELAMGVGAGGLNAAQIGQLNGQRVIIALWGSADYDEMNARYFTEVESRLTAPLSHKMGWTRLEGLKAHGSPMQLVRRETAFMGFTPVPLPGDALDYGWMMAGTGVGHFQNVQAYSVSGEKTGLERTIEMLSGLVLGKKG